MRPHHNTPVDGDGARIKTRPGLDYPSNGDPKKGHGPRATGWWRPQRSCVRACSIFTMVMIFTSRVNPCF